MAAFAFDDRCEVFEKFDAQGCIVREALELAAIMLGKQEVEEIIERGIEEKIRDLVCVFVWLNLSQKRFILTCNDTRLHCTHWLLGHLHASEFFLGEQGWFNFLSPDA